MTLYFRGEFMGNMHRVEARAYSVTVGKYAQYDQAVFVAFLAKGKRKARGFVQGYRPDLLVLDDWGHPEPAPLFGEPAPGEITVEAAHSSCSDGWARDFAAIIDPYIAAHPGIVLHDYRQAVGPELTDEEKAERDAKAQALRERIAALQKR